MKQIQADIWETKVENPAKGLYTHAYLLLRNDGNVLFYNTSHIDEIERMAALGGVARHYLSHRDELGESLNTVAERFGAELGGHVRELNEFSRFRRPTILFERREMHLGNIEVIPTPGHSPGSTCFYVSALHGKRYLFTGDTLWFSGNRVLEAAFLSNSDFDAYVKSLETLRALEPDFVISSATGGHGGYSEIAPGEWPGHVDRALERLMAKQSNIGP
ncbi:MBL fold metallo-hydrolase [Pusillimonas sp.]|uniref:MBL fold metallo-hydrolase n=1 Tax=Pusillimonas sp. TaxID=3040095 RepID=UPI0029B0B455|nr:MBL fold metallo-hydrolase [Pusillimonas sp.]MDX3896235.1 MBL fold metallo-hydrolase [Pusillimonas sp.]